MCTRSPASALISKTKQEYEEFAGQESSTTACAGTKFEVHRPRSAAFSFFPFASSAAGPGTIDTMNTNHRYNEHRCHHRHIDRHAWYPPGAVCNLRQSLLRLLLQAGLDHRGAIASHTGRQCMRPGLEGKRVDGRELLIHTGTQAHRHTGTQAQTHTPQTRARACRPV